MSHKLLQKSVSKPRKPAPFLFSVFALHFLHAAQNIFLYASVLSNCMRFLNAFSSLSHCKLHLPALLKLTNKHIVLFNLHND